MRTASWLLTVLLVCLAGCKTGDKTTPPPKEDGSDDEISSLTVKSIKVATWNLEYFHQTSKRGFPEYTRKGKGLPPRTDSDYQAIADVIEDLGFSVLMLQEIQGVDDKNDPSIEKVKSPALDTLLKKFNGSWAYRVGTTGSKQRLAFLYDTAVVRLNSICEISDGETFERDPLVGHFTILQDGKAKNDFVLVSLHLKSGREEVEIHDAEMASLDAGIDKLLKAGDIIPSAEADFVLGGDLNADRWDKDVEEFWDLMEAEDWDVLANDDTYPATRLNKEPPEDYDSTLDYIIISKWEGGLAGNEVTETVGNVHSDLVDEWGVVAFRKSLSDHIPVSITVSIRNDDD
jgi:endonuclease/exonuclease/phosphatase family metal-dependent hydrolase